MSIYKRGTGYRVQGAGCRVQGAGYRVQGTQRGVSLRGSVQPGSAAGGVLDVDEASLRGCAESTADAQGMC